jgi:hypothetical protein
MAMHHHVDTGTGTFSKDVSGLPIAEHPHHVVVARRVPIGFADQRHATTLRHHAPSTVKHTDVASADAGVSNSAARTTGTSFFTEVISRLKPTEIGE